MANRHGAARGSRLSAVGCRSPGRAAGSVALLEPPGFLMLNYELQTPFVNLVAHIAYGAIVGGFVGLAG